MMTLSRTFSPGAVGLCDEDVAQQQEHGSSIGKQRLAFRASAGIPAKSDGSLCRDARRLVPPDVQPKERSSFPYLSSIIPRRRSDSLRGAAGLRKDQTENIGRVSQHSRRLQRFDALLSRRHAARGLKRFICCDLKIVRPLRGLFYVHCPAHVGAWISTESHPAAVPGRTLDDCRGFA